MKLSEFKEKVIEIHGKKVWEKLEKSFAYRVYTDTEEMQLLGIWGNPSRIQFIHKPSEKVQLMAVKEDLFTLHYIENPSKEIQLEAVKRNPFIIEYIHNPSEEVQLEAVKQNVTAIGLIKNPTDKILEEVLKRLDKARISNYILRHIENDLKEVKKEEVNDTI